MRRHSRRPRPAICDHATAKPAMKMLSWLGRPLAPVASLGGQSHGGLKVSGWRFQAVPTNSTGVDQDFVEWPWSHLTNGRQIGRLVVAFQEFKIQWPDGAQCNDRHVPLMSRPLSCRDLGEFGQIWACPNRDNSVLFGLYLNNFVRSWTHLLELGPMLAELGQFVARLVCFRQILS